MERTKLGFCDWLARVSRPGRDYLTVPSHIMELPCGHRRHPGANEFAIRRTAAGWVHDFEPCEDKVLAEEKILALPPDRQPDASKKSQRARYLNHAPYLMRMS